MLVHEEGGPIEDELEMEVRAEVDSDMRLENARMGKTHETYYFREAEPLWLVMVSDT